MRLFLLAIATGLTAESSVAPTYDGEWRRVCGDPARWSDYEVVGPEGAVVAVAEARGVVIAEGDRKELTVELAGVVPAAGADEVMTSLLPVGAHIETFFYRAQSGRKMVGRVERNGRDVGLTLIVSGAASYQHSRDLTSYNNCLYLNAEGAARKAHIGLWSEHRR